MEKRWNERNHKKYDKLHGKVEQMNKIEKLNKEDSKSLVVNFLLF